MLERWPSFTRFLDDGRVCLSNNAAERVLRGIAVGRRNRTFAGSDAGDRRAAAIYTLVEPAGSTTSTRASGSPTSSPACRTTRPGAWTTSCPGTGPRRRRRRVIAATAAGKSPNEWIVGTIREAAE